MGCMNQIFTNVGRDQSQSFRNMQIETFELIQYLLHHFFSYFFFFIYEILLNVENQVCAINTDGHLFTKTKCNHNIYTVWDAIWENLPHVAQGNFAEINKII